MPLQYLDSLLARSCKARILAASKCFVLYVTINVCVLTRPTQLSRNKAELVLSLVYFEVTRQYKTICSLSSLSLLKFNIKTQVAVAYWPQPPVVDLCSYYC